MTAFGIGLRLTDSNNIKALMLHVIYRKYSVYLCFRVKRVGGNELRISNPGSVSYFYLVEVKMVLI